MKGIKLMAQLDKNIPKPKNKRLTKDDGVLIKYMIKFIGETIEVYLLLSHKLLSYVNLKYKLSNASFSRAW